MTGAPRNALAGNRRSASPGSLSAAAGSSGANPETDRRDARPRHAAIDRVIQQAVLQRLQPLWDPTFSEYSYGFRPNRSAHQAVAQAQAYVTEGYRLVVDLDLAKFFDRVNHDRLMARVAARISDRRVLRLIRS